MFPNLSFPTLPSAETVVESGTDIIVDAISLLFGRAGDVVTIATRKIATPDNLLKAGVVIGGVIVTKEALKEIGKEMGIELMIEFLKELKA